MRLILTNSLDPYYNLACEEYYLRDTEDDVFMHWQNRPTVVIGRNQNLYDEVDLSYTEKEGIEVVRRITGGGAVYHDLGNVNYSFITSREKAAVLDFDYFTRPIRDTLLSLGIEAVLSGRNDLVVSAPDGSFLKFSGNAETATDRRILSHGTLLFDSDLGVLSKALKPDPEKLKKRAIQSVRSRVTNLKPLVSDQKMETPEFFSFLIRAIESRYGIAREAALEAETIRGYEKRNREENYIAGRKKTYDRMFRKRFESGLVVLLYDLRDGCVSGARIEGDYFGELDTEALAGLLNGTPEKDLPGAVRLIPVERYIAGVSGEMFASILCTEA